MAIISLGTINKKILFAIISGSLKLFANIILYHSEIKMNDHPCILGINAGIGLCLAFFPHLYIYLRSRRLYDQKSSTLITDEYLIYNDNASTVEDEKRKKKYYYILSVAICEFIQKFLTFFYVSLFLENFWIFDSFLLMVFSFLILKTKIYAHHFFSLVMIIIIGIILISINYYNKEITFWHVIITLVTEIFFSLEFVFCKLTMDHKFSSPYEICMHIGFLELIIFTLLLILSTNIPISSSESMNHLNNEYIDNFFIYIRKFNWKELLIFIFCMLLRGNFILFGFITVDHFTPSHIVLIIIIGECSAFFLDPADWKLYVKIFFFIILIFFVLIFVEILELNIFGLQNNTKKNIINRSESENLDNISQGSDIDNELRERNLSFMEDQRLSIIKETEK